ncbi:hypothetical protein [Mesorhizobium sp. B1-1-5]|uniref:hypothetical protein n=1 Tax=Mesorhizobium sp. B1-1-5 TaxID=2589979 RepID=UPI0011266FE8|nr:hypothetical protein [Mesorhizobium sp. B1-1-5]TPN90008.1 hypothetical protein FJ980_30165 [Mesorhizobium sp. B1-1-5]
MSRTKAKAAPAGEGHNSKELTENERKSLFFHHLRKRMAHNANIAEAGAAKKADGKTAQADGLVLGDIDYAIKAIGADDKKTVTDRFVAEGEILSWLGLSSGFQSDMFRDRAPAVEKIERAGELAGLAALGRTSGYATGSDEDTRWLDAYDRGQATVRDNFEAAMLKRNAAKDELIKGADNGDDPFDDADADLEAAE